MSEYADTEADDGGIMSERLVASHPWVFPLAAALGAATFFGIVKTIVWAVT